VKRYVLLLALAVSLPATAMNKCVVGGKTVYQEAACPQGAAQKPIAQRVQGGASGAAATATGGAWPKLPELKPGKWTIEGNGEPKPVTLCGHPLDSLYKEYGDLAKLREHGCTVNATSPREGSVQVSTNCPAGSKLGEVQSAFTVVSPNPGYVSVLFTHKGRQQVQSAKRMGDC